MQLLKDSAGVLPEPRTGKRLHYVLPTSVRVWQFLRF